MDRIAPQLIQKRLTYSAWSLGAFVTALAVFVWGQSLAWRFSGISPYQFFPVLGLIGFSLMWTHYIIAFCGRLVGGRADERYFRYTGYAVLLAIVLHPGILIYQRFRDGFGLPPKSYESYVAPGMAWVTLLGSVSLLIFLSFELHRWFGGRRWWKYVILAGDMAMLAVFYHGLRLGTQTHIGWYRTVWLIYGVMLVISITYKYVYLLRKRNGTA